MSRGAEGDRARQLDIGGSSDSRLAGTPGKVARTSKIAPIQKKASSGTAQSRPAVEHPSTDWSDNPAMDAALLGVPLGGSSNSQSLQLVETKEDNSQGSGKADDPWTGSSSHGKFKVDPYEPYDTDDNKDTRKQVGTKLEIHFTPGTAVRSEKISFVQVMKSTKSGKPYLFENEKPRATKDSDGDAGWAVDRANNKNSPNYGEQNDGKESGSTVKFGHRKSASDHKDAWMYDRVRLNRAQGQTVEGTATTFALDNDSNKYLGSVEWGYTCDDKGKVTTKALKIQSMENPGGIQKRALERWNEQAEGPESDRNHPDQKKVPVP